MNKKIYKNPIFFCWSVWLFCFAWALTIVLISDKRYPWSDEWNFVPYLTGVRAVTWAWLWEQHVDHRIPIVKVIYLILSRLFPVDFRPPIYFNVLLMSTLAAILIHAARKIRKQQNYADAFFPLFTTHMGLGFWSWGFSIQFVFPTFLIGLMMIVWTIATTKANIIRGKYACVCLSSLTLLLPLCGSNGLVLSLGCLFFLIWTLRQKFFLSAQPFFNRLIMGTSALFTLFLQVFYFSDLVKTDHGWGKLTLASFLKTTAWVYTAPLGFVFTMSWLITLLSFFLFSWLWAKLIRELPYMQPNDRLYSCGMMFLWVSVAALGPIVGYGRGARVWTLGLAVHYSTLCLPLFLGTYLVAIRLQLTRFCFVSFVLSVVIYCLYMPISFLYSFQIRQRMKTVDMDMKRDITLDAFISNQVSQLFFIDTNEARNLIREGMLALAQQSIKTNSTSLQKNRKFATALKS